ncbi:MAG: hypothetical protein CSYNP_03752 [Syntrophus sp. SKADARSKE-3]|nr:hypothetical protein [Syntrophus sp. SKADARSKE-3]
MGLLMKKKSKIQKNRGIRSSKKKKSKKRTKADKIIRKKVRKIMEETGIPERLMEMIDNANGENVKVIVERQSGIPADRTQLIDVDPKLGMYLKDNMVPGEKMNITNLIRRVRGEQQ